MAIAVAVSAFVALVSLVLSLLILRELRTLTSVFRKGHGEPCPDPSAAAVVTEGSPPPVLARTATQGRTPALPPAPQSGQHLVPEPTDGPPTPPSTVAGDDRAARTTSTRPPPPVEVLRAPHATTEARPAPPAIVDERMLSPPSPSDDSDGDRATGDAATAKRPAPSLDARITRLWHHKIAEALEAGQNARHCAGARCFDDSEAISVCECDCAGCVLVGELYLAAKRELTGRE